MYYWLIQNFQMYQMENVFFKKIINNIKDKLVYVYYKVKIKMIQLYGVINYFEFCRNCCVNRIRQKLFNIL